jgi:hypothetical protein
MLEACSELPEDEILSEAAAELLSERLMTPLQIIQYLDLAFQHAYQVPPSHKFQQSGARIL